jgi:hypothetical protein
MPRMRLTDRSVRALKARAGKRRTIFDTITPGLALRCTENGVKNFYFVYRTPKRPSSGVNWLRLGYPDDLKLADARDQVRKHRAGLVDGVDPVVEKRRAREGKTFDQLALAFVENLRDERNVVRGATIGECSSVGRRRRRTPSAW